MHAMVANPSRLTARDAISRSTNALDDFSILSILLSPAFQFLIHR